MPQTGYVPINLYRTTNPATVPTLLNGEPAVTLAPANVTKFWVGDGTAARLLLSTEAGDTPLMTARYARLAGATFTGAPQWATVPSNNADLTNKAYVDQAVASGQLYQGTWNPDNSFDLTVPANQPTVNGAYFVVSPGGTITAALPGLTPPVTVNNGDHLIWNQTAGTFSIIAAGGMTQTDADARFVQLTGSTMTGTTTPLLLNSFPLNASSNALQATTKGYVDTLVGDYLPLAGGTMDTVTDQGGGIIIPANDTTWYAHPGLTITNDDSLAISIANTGNTRGIEIYGDGVGVQTSNAGGGFASNVPATATAAGFYAQGGGATAPLFEALVAANTIGMKMSISASATGMEITGQGNLTGTAIDINNQSTGASTSLRVRRAATNYFTVASDGVTAVGAPTGPAVTGAGNINVQGGYYVNGVALSTTVSTDGTSIGGDGAAAVTTPGTGPLHIVAVDGGTF